MATAEFSKFADILSAVLSQHHLLGFEIAPLNSITTTSFVCSDPHGNRTELIYLFEGGGGGESSRKSFWKRLQ